ncbi:XisI protein [Chloroflexi bacterium TSY]|nr:XisI protein [Chloroflexi bacterium TSY]
MDKKVETYKKCVKELLLPYESLHTERSKVELIFDDERMRYMAVRVGWSDRKRLHLCLVHIDICDNKIIIQCNNTEDLIISELEEMGVPRPDICSGFLPPELRTIADQPERQPELALA